MKRFFFVLRIWKKYHFDNNWYKKGKGLNLRTKGFLRNVIEVPPSPGYREPGEYLISY